MATSQKEQSGPKIGGKPIFSGNTALIRFVNGGDVENSTIWFAEKDSQTIRPFVSESQFEQIFDNPIQAMKAVVTLSADELGPGGLFEDFKVLGNEYAVNPGEEIKKPPFSPAALQKRYGKPINPEAESRTVQVLDGMFSKILGEGEQMAIEEPSGITGPQTTPPFGIERPASPDIGMGGPDGKGDPGSSTVRWCDGKGGILEELQARGYAFSPQEIEARTKEVTDAMARFGLTFGDPVTGSVTNPTNTLHTYNAKELDLSNQKLIEKQLRNMISAAEIQPNDSFQDAPDAWFEEVLQNSELMGMYVGAGTYGGYSLTDIYADIVRLFKAKSDPSLANKVIINPTVTKNSYSSTPEGKIGRSVVSSVVPIGSKMRGIDFDKFANYSVGNMPDEVFDLILPAKDYESPDVLAEAEQIATVAQDALIERAKANTEEEKERAEYNWGLAKDAIEEKYNIQLSNNSQTAWNQIVGILDNMSTRGLAGTGIEEQKIQYVGRSERAKNALLEKAKAKEKEAEDYKYFVENASPEEINDFILKNPEKAREWRLVPPQSVLDQFSMSALKAKYPNATDKELQSARDSILDEFGHYRSTKYQTLYDKLNDPDKGLIPGKLLAQISKLQLEEEATRTRMLDAANRKAQGDYGGYEPDIPITGGVDKGTSDNTYTKGKDTTPPKDSGTTQTPTGGSTSEGQQGAVQYDTAPTQAYLYKGNPNNDPAEVKKLQQWLISKGFLAEGLDTGYFGDLTKNALTEYQKQQESLNSGYTTSGNYGYYGPATKAWIAKQPISTPKISGGTSTNSLAGLSQSWINAQTSLAGKTGVDYSTAYQKVLDAQAAYNKELQRQQALADKANSLYQSPTELNKYLNSLSQEDRAIINSKIPNLGSLSSTTSTILSSTPGNVQTTEQIQQALDASMAKLKELQAQQAAEEAKAAKASASAASNINTSGSTSGLTTGTTTPSVPTPTPTTPTTPTPAVPSSPYSFKKVGGNVEIYLNGQRISTGSPSYAQTYGYTGN